MWVVELLFGLFCAYFVIFVRPDLGLILVAIFVGYLILRKLLKKRKAVSSRESIKSSEVLRKIMVDIDDFMHAEIPKRSVRLGIHSITDVGEVPQVNYVFTDADLAERLSRYKAERLVSTRTKIELFSRGEQAKASEYEAQQENLNTLRTTEIIKSIFGPYMPGSVFKDPMDTDVKVLGDSICFTSYEYIPYNAKRVKDGGCDTLLLMEAVIEKAKAKYPDINIYADRTIPG